MSSKTPLAINYFESDAAMQVLPRPPVLSSYSLGWNGIDVEYHHQPPWEMPEHVHLQHIIPVHHRNEVIFQERMMDGRVQREQLIDGSTAIIPAYVPNHSDWYTDGTFTVLMLDPLYVAQVARESIDADRVQIIPQFAMSDPVIWSIALALKSELSLCELQNRFYVETAAVMLAAHLIKHYATLKQPFQQSLQKYVNGLPKHKLQQAVEYMHAHLNQDIKLVDIAHAVDMSQYHFLRLFKQSTGTTPCRYLTERRIERAKQLLRNPHLSIAEISLECGFANHSHLTRWFRKLTGITPKAFRCSNCH
jgi:AraC family transcriptional regulator